LKRLQEARDSDERLSAISNWTVENLNSYTLFLAVLIIFAAIIPHAPIVTSDCLRKMRLLQYSSKEGRSLLRKQFAAVMLSQALLTTALLLVFGGIYTANGTRVFWNSYVYSFNSFYFTTLPVTYGQYVMLLIAMLYVTGFAVSAFTFILSRSCSNYITLTAGAVCLCVFAIILYGFAVFYAPLNFWAKQTGFALSEQLICAAALAIGVFVSVRLIRRERKIDIS
jgi:hypothetical protein